MFFRKKSPRNIFRGNVMFNEKDYVKYLEKRNNFLSGELTKINKEENERLVKENNARYDLCLIDFYIGSLSKEEIREGIRKYLRESL